MKMVRKKEYNKLSAPEPPEPFQMINIERVEYNKS